MAKAAKLVRIHFEDRGQDFLWWDLEDRGDGYSYRVVDCGPFQAWMWTRFFVTQASVKVGRQPLCTSDEKTASHLNYRIVKIEKRGAGAHKRKAA